MSGYLLKMIALATMFLDHVGEFFPKQTPVTLRWIGRISAPIFFFMMAQAMHHTRSRQKYFFRLYMGSMTMGIGNYLFNYMLPMAPVPVRNNIFSTLLLSALSIHLIELFQKDEREGKRQLYAFAGYNAAAIVLVKLAENFLGGAEARLVSALLPNPILTEGGIFFVGIGIALYFWRDDPWKLSCFYGAFSLMELMGAVSQHGWLKALDPYYQWMMIFALPLMLCYNGQKGRSAKKLFYLFYPVHIWTLFLLSNVLVGWF